MESLTLLIYLLPDFFKSFVQYFLYKMITWKTAKLQANYTPICKEELDSHPHTPC